MKQAVAAQGQQLQQLMLMMQANLERSRSMDQSEANKPTTETTSTAPGPRKTSAAIKVSVDASKEPTFMSEQRQHSPTPKELMATDADQRSARQNHLNALYNEDPDEERLPSAYRDHNLMLPIARQYIGRARFPGIRADALLEQMPFVQDLIKRSQNSNVLKSDAIDRPHLFASLSSHHPLLPLDNIKQVGSDIKTTFAQFCSFVAIFEPSADGGMRTDFSFDLLLSPLRLQAFVAFLVQAQKAPQTIKNKILHLRQGVRLLKSKEKLHHLLPRCKQVGFVLKQLCRDVGYAISAHISCKPTEAVLLTRGQFFYPEERSIFSKWLILGILSFNLFLFFIFNSKVSFQIGFML